MQYLLFEEGNSYSQHGSVSLSPYIEAILRFSGPTLTMSLPSKNGRDIRAPSEAEPTTPDSYGNRTMSVELQLSILRAEF
jgi:hypothetical protein